VNTSLIVVIALAFSSPILTQAQTAAASKPAPAEAKLPSAATARKVSPDKFKSEYALVGQPQTMHVITYLGQRDGRAYINRKSRSPFGPVWTDHVIYVELSELEPSFRESLPKSEFKDGK